MTTTTTTTTTTQSDPRLTDENEELHPADHESMTMAEFRREYPELDSEFEWLSRQSYDFEPDDRVTIVEQGRQHGGHLRLHGPGYSIQFSQGEPIVEER